MLADFIVLDHNIFEIAPENIRDVKVLRTVVDGSRCMGIIKLINKSFLA